MKQKNGPHKGKISGARWRYAMRVSLLLALLAALLAAYFLNSDPSREKAAVARSLGMAWTTSLARYRASAGAGGRGVEFRDAVWSFIDWRTSIGEAVIFAEIVTVFGPPDGTAMAERGGRVHEYRYQRADGRWCVYSIVVDSQNRVIMVGDTADKSDMSCGEPTKAGNADHAPSPPPDDSD